MDGPDPLDIFSDEPGTFVVGDAKTMVLSYLDPSLWHSIIRYFGSSVLVADDAG